MRLVIVDDARQAFKNERMNRKAGARVRVLRAERGWKQAELAKKAKVAIGTVQTLESGKRLPRWTSVEKIARALGKTPEALLQDEEIKPTDPLLAGLNREDLMIARAFHDSTTLMRQRVATLLRDGEDEQLAALAVRLAKLSPEMRASFDGLITEAEKGQPLTDERASKPATSKPTRS